MILLIIGISILVEIIYVAAPWKFTRKLAQISAIRLHSFVCQRWCFIFDRSAQLFWNIALEWVLKFQITKNLAKKWKVS